MGLLFEPENASELAEKTLLLAQDQKLRATLSQNGQKAAPRYDRKSRANEMLLVLEKVAGGDGEIVVKKKRY